MTLRRVGNLAISRNNTSVVGIEVNDTALVMIGARGASRARHVVSGCDAIKEKGGPLPGRLDPS
jgi:hypothetical protein